MSQDSVTGLAKLSVENSRAHNLDLQAVVKTFAHRKGRLQETRGVSQVGFNLIEFP
jgi:hypothetical protein